MTNEEKSMELAEEYKYYTHLNAIHLHLEKKTKEEVVEQCVCAAALEMAAWKEKQMAEKANKAYCEVCMTEDCERNIKSCIWLNRFKKAMEE